MTQLVDVLGRKHTYLRLSVTDRCNLCCTYCMPAGGVSLQPAAELLTLKEIERICRVFASLGITKVRLTGGEPLVRSGIVELAGRIAALPGIRHVGITTNGVLLAALADQLRAAGVSRVNISIDSLNAARYRRITMRDELPRVLAGVEAALSAGFAAVGLNVVVIKGVNEDEVLDFVEFARWRPISVRFIEYMPVGRAWAQPTPCVPTADLIELIGGRYTMSPAESSGGMHHVARQYAVAGLLGTVAFIPGVTEHFCGSCNRMRVTAAGQFKTCLHYSAELNLRDTLRAGASDSILAELIIDRLRSKREGKPWTLPGQPGARTECLEQLAMNRIGG